MSKVSTIFFVLTLVCIAGSAMVGNAMCRRVHSRSGRSFWPAPGNTQLAKEYRALFGADRNYVAYRSLNVGTLIGVLLWVLSSARFG
jgi:hypothetical protein